MLVLVAAVVVAAGAAATAVAAAVAAVVVVLLLLLLVVGQCVQWGLVLAAVGVQRVWAAAVGWKGWWVPISA